MHEYYVREKLVPKLIKRGGNETVELQRKMLNNNLSEVMVLQQPVDSITNEEKDEFLRRHGITTSLHMSTIPRCMHAVGFR